MGGEGKGWGLGNAGTVVRSYWELGDGEFAADRDAAVAVADDDDVSGGSGAVVVGGAVAHDGCVVGGWKVMAGLTAADAAVVAAGVGGRAHASASAAAAAAVAGAGVDLSDGWAHCQCSCEMGHRGRSNSQNACGDYINCNNTICMSTFAQLPITVCCDLQRRSQKMKEGYAITVITAC